MLAVVVVFPTPPLPEVITITRAFAMFGVLPFNKTYTNQIIQKCQSIAVLQRVPGNYHGMMSMAPLWMRAHSAPFVAAVLLSDSGARA